MHVTQAWRHPAKSMQGDTVDELVVGPLGVLGDRVWAVRDDGIRGAKKIGGLMALRARFLAEPTAAEPAPPIEITLPDGTTVRSGDADVDAVLSKALDHEVTLCSIAPPDDLDHYRRGAPSSDDFDAEVRGIFGRLPDEPLPDFTPFLHVLEFESPPGTYVDAYPLHLLTTQTLEWAGADVRRFRPNLVVDAGAGEERFPERSWLGRRIAVGDEVLLEVVYDCPRCVMITRPFADLPQDRDLLRKVVRDADQNIGVYANVVEPGVIHPGDEVRVL
jgi:uncharacterized protein YcbX